MVESSFKDAWNVQTLVCAHLVFALAEYKVLIDWKSMFSFVILYGLNLKCKYIAGFAQNQT